MVEQTTVICIPDGFFSKEKNEDFIKLIMERALNRHSWDAGDPNLGEPDYFCDGIPFEFTLAADKQQKRQYGFIEKYKLGLYSTEDQEKDAFEMIERAINKKSKKTYSTQNNHLCVLCI